MQKCRIVLFLLLIATASFAELKQVSLQLQWKYQFQFAGYIVAKEKGFYKDAGLDVEIKEWHEGVNMVDEVISGRSQYALARATSMIDINQGKDIVYLAAIFQSTPLILMTDKKTGIKNIKDFKNKRVMSTGDLNTDTSLLSMMFSQGVQLDDLKIEQPSFDPADLLSGKTDLMAAYISNEPFVLKELGGTPVIFSPKEHGFDFYNDLLITSKEHLLNENQEVKNFREATLKGWEYAFNNIEETIQLIREKYNTQKKSKAALRYEAEELKKLAYFKTEYLGKLDKAKLRKSYDVYRLLGLVGMQEIDFTQHIYSETFLKTQLSLKEKEYLKNKKTITMCIDPNWMPFEHFDPNGQYEGMSADYYKLFGKNLGVDFKVIKSGSWSESIEFAKQRKCDIFSLAMETPERKKYMNFTSAYLKIPLVVTTRLDVPFVNEIKELRGKKIGISKGYAFVEILREKYPDLNIIEVEDIDDGLDRVNSGELFGYVGTLASVGYKFQTKYAGELKITGKIADDWELGIGVRNDDLILLSVLQKAVENVSKDQHREIFNKWISIKYERGIDYSLFWKTILIFSAVILGGLYVIRQQAKLKGKLEETNHKLEEAYLELQKLAVSDKLTGLYNRHKLDKVLISEKNRADRYGSSFGLMLLDIDHFKRINDVYGHQIGDLVLQEFAKLLEENSRESDVIGRWGGEEFLIIVPEVSRESLSYFAENLRMKIEAQQFNSQYKITTSIGVAIYKNRESVESILIRADEALYVSKNGGRNKVTFKD